MNVRKINRLAPKSFSQQLRRDQTDEEAKLWCELRARRFANFKFRRQQIIGPYIADFLCISRKLIIEADGRHHSVDKDQARDEFLRKRGYRILRFSNDEIRIKFEFVTDNIWQALHNTKYDPDKA